MRCTCTGKPAQFQRPALFAHLRRSTVILPCGAALPAAAATTPCFMGLVTPKAADGAVGSCRSRLRQAAEGVDSNAGDSIERHGHLDIDPVVKSKVLQAAQRPSIAAWPMRVCISTGRAGAALAWGRPSGAAFRCAGLGLYQLQTKKRYRQCPGEQSFPGADAGGQGKQRSELGASSQAKVQRLNTEDQFLTYGRIA